MPSVQVYEFAKTAARWGELLPRDGTFSIDCRLRSCTGLNHSGMVAGLVIACQQIR